MTELLSPTNDYVFKRLFGESPDLLLNLINDLRYDIPPIASLDILNSNIEPSCKRRSKTAYICRISSSLVFS